MASNYTWESISTPHDFGGVLGRPLDTFFWALRASPLYRRNACSRKALWRAPSLQPIFLTRHSPTVSCFLALHIEKVSGIFPVSLNTSGWGQKEPGMWAQQGATLTCEDSEWSPKFEEPWQSRPRDWRGVGHVFLQGRVKGLAKTLSRGRVDTHSQFLGHGSWTRMWSGHNIITQHNALEPPI